MTTKVSRRSLIRFAGIAAAVCVDVAVNPALAATWQKIGGAGGPAGTWQKINAASGAAATWRKLGKAPISRISAGGYHSLALRSDGAVFACGNNNYGQLGDGTTVNKSTFFQVPGLASVTALAAGVTTIWRYVRMA